MDWIFSFPFVSSQKYSIVETLYSAAIDTGSIVDAFLSNVDRSWILLNRNKVIIWKQTQFINYLNNVLLNLL